MALAPIDEAHALQIQAGTLGRRAGHAFEDEITRRIDALEYPLRVNDHRQRHIFTGDPALALLNYVARYHQKPSIQMARAISTGALATSEEGRQWLSINGANISRCKSDIVLTLVFRKGDQLTVGVSTKQCRNRTPTNAQLYFTTARGFARLLQNSGIPVSEMAVVGLRQFCGDLGFRPLDQPAKFAHRRTDPRRFFWEEIDPAARREWEHTFAHRQSEITQLLLQKAYIEDTFAPEFLLHKTRAAENWQSTECAIYAIDELVALSAKYRGYESKGYCVRKGTYKDPPDTVHLAPRFGIVQMQRGGQQQHPEQLQFNLEAGYFYRLENV